MIAGGYDGDSHDDILEFVLNEDAIHSRGQMTQARAWGAVSAVQSQDYYPWCRSTPGTMYKGTDYERKIFVRSFGKMESFFCWLCNGHIKCISSILVNVTYGYTPPAPQARGGLKEIIQFSSYRLAKPLKPIFLPKVEKSEAN